MADQQRYQLIFEELMDKSEDGFIVIDTEGIITDINDKYCDFLGRKKENILGKPIEQIISTTSMYDVMNRRQRGDDAESIYMQPYVASETKASRKTYAIANRFCIFDENEQLIGAMAQMKFKERSLDIAHEVLKAEHDYYKAEYQNQMMHTSGFDKYLGNDPKIHALRIQNRFFRINYRRNRHRQGTYCQIHPYRKPSGQRTSGLRQLRRHSDGTHGI